MSDQQHDAQTGPSQGGEAPGGAEFRCGACGHRQTLPEQLLGRQAKCPKCGQLGLVVSPAGRTASEPDLRVDDLADPETARPVVRPASASGDSLALDAAPPLESSADHLRQLFAGNPLLNLLSGLVGGAHVALTCLALAMLLFAVTPAAGLAPHSLVLLLLPAVFGGVLLALAGRLPVAVGAPEPSAVLCVSLLLGAVGADLAGRVPAQDISATLLAALTVAGLASGLLGVLLARMGLAERMRFLPGEVMGGMLAGFGVLLIKAWFAAQMAATPLLAGLAGKPLADIGQDLLQLWPGWAPAVVFGLLYFVVHMGVRGLLWPLLLTAVAVGAWNALDFGLFVLPPQLAPLQAALTGPQARLPQMLNTGCYLALFEPATLAHIHWPALLDRTEFFAAVAAVAILPSIVRTPILESVLCREADAGRQMGLVGVSSMLSGALGGMPASLSLSSTLGVRALGAGGPMAGLVAGLSCLALLLAGQPALPYIPRFVPLGLLLATGLIMPVSWMLRDARNPLTNKDDLRAAWASCLMVVLLGPVLGVFAGLGLGVALSLSRSVAGGGVRFRQSGDVFRSNVERSRAELAILREQGGRILVLRLRGYLFLGTLYGLMETIKERLRGGPLSYVLLDFGAVDGLGATAAIGFRRLESLARERGIILYLTSVPLEMEDHLEGLGYRMDDDSGVCRVALNLDYALERCEDAILAEAGHAAGGDGAQQQTLEEILAATFPEPRLVSVLLKCLVREEVKPKAHIITQGDPSNAMYFLQSGKVQVELSLRGGKVLRLMKMGPGTVFGEMGIYTSAPRSASVIATEPCVVYKLSVERFALIQQKAPQLAAAVNRFIVALLAERVSQANAQARAIQLG